MKRFWQIAIMLFGLLLVFPACGDDDDDEDDNDLSWMPVEVDEAWRDVNVAAFAEKEKDESMEYIYSESGNGRILYKVLKEGDGTEPIYYNSIVSCYYKGCYVTDEEGNRVQDLNNVLTEGEVFVSYLKEDGEEPQYCSAASQTYNSTSINFVDGFGTALQHMHVGDVWEVWVPYSLGYGTTGERDYYGNILHLPYTTLVFQIEVVEIVEQ